MAAGGFALLAAPLLLAAVRVHRRAWVPAGDDAALVHRLGDVATSRTPLVGPYSTRGWAHPGPAGYELLAPIHRLLGGHPADALTSAALLNVAALGLICWLLARRLRGAALLVALATVGLLVRTLGPDLLVQTWNPYLPLLPYLALLLSLWQIGARDWRLLPLAVGLGSVVIQLHVAYLPLVGIGFVTATVVALGWRPTTDPASVVEAGLPPRRTPELRTLGVSAVVAGVLWAPVAVDLVWGDRNPVRLFRYFTRAAPDTIGSLDGLGLTSRHLGPFGPLTGHPDSEVFGNVPPQTTWWLVLALALLVGASSVAARVRRADLALPVVAGGQLVVGAWAAGRIEEPVLAYLVVWMIPLAAFCWLAIAVVATQAAQARAATTTRADRLPVPRLIGAGALVVLVATSASSTVAAWDVELPREEVAPVVISLADQLERTVRRGDRVQIEGVGDPVFEVWPGVVGQLAEHGVDFWTTDGADGQKWGVGHRGIGSSTDYALTFVTAEAGRSAATADPCAGRADQHRVATWDQLTRAERDELRALQLRQFAARHDLPGRAGRRVEELGDRSLQVHVYRGPEPCALSTP